MTLEGFSSLIMIPILVFRYYRRLCPRFKGAENLDFLSTFYHDNMSRYVKISQDHGVTYIQEYTTLYLLLTTKTVGQPPSKVTRDTSWAKIFQKSDFSMNYSIILKLCEYFEKRFNLHFILLFYAKFLIMTFFYIRWNVSVLKMHIFSHFYHFQT